MEFLKDHFYKVCFNIGGKILTYTCKVTENSSKEDQFVTFIDKFGKQLTYNKLNIISVEEVNDGAN